jgi:hypothetical protein
MLCERVGGRSGKQEEQRKRVTAEARESRNGMKRAREEEDVAVGKERAWFCEEGRGKSRLCTLQLAANRQRKCLEAEKAPSSARPTR